MYLAECRERGIPILAPDINASELHFSVAPGRGVRFGLTAIRGLGEGAGRAVIEARQPVGGRIPSLHALCEVIDLRVVNKRVLEALVKSGACDSLGGDLTGGPEGPPLRAGHPDVEADLQVGLASTRRIRARLFASIESACEHGNRTQRNNDLGQADLFGVGDVTSTQTGPTSPIRRVPDWSEIEQLQYEKESLGLYWSGHPVDRYRDALRLYGAKSTADLLPKREEEDLTNGAGSNGNNGYLAEGVSIGGIVSSMRPLKTRKGDRMCVFMVDDAHGSIEVVVFPDAFKQYGHILEDGRMVLVKGKFERDDESARLLAGEVLPIEMLRERLTRSVAIKVSTPPHDRRTFEQLWDVFAHHKGDRPVAFDIELRQAERGLRVTVDVNAQIRVHPSEQLVTEVEKICGVGSVTLR
jgi:DNA polymerase-3 subunit alpha